MVKHYKILILEIITCFIIIVCIMGGCQKNDPPDKVWEKEFYHCAEVMKEEIENMDSSEFPLPEYDEMVREKKIEIYLDSWQKYLNFVENWINYAGGTWETEEDIYETATLLMVLIDNNHNANYEFTDFNKEYYEFLYYHEIPEKELLLNGNRALQQENIIDANMKQLREEFEHVDYYGELYTLEAEAWKNEFHNCMIMYETVFSSQTDSVGEIKILKLWEEFIECWAENNEKFAGIDAGSGMNIDIAMGKKESYRTAALLMISYFEQYFGEYEFIYDVKKDREIMLKIG